LEAAVYNPAFDVTPAGNITAIITERGVAYPPYEANLRGMEADPEFRAAGCRPYGGKDSGTSPE
jgi:hypothetical protein